MMFPPREKNAEGEGGGTYLRLKDKEKATGIVKGKIHVFYAIGFGADTRIVGPGEGGKKKYRVNFVVKEGSDYVAKIWEFGPKIYDSLSLLESEGWDLSKTLITVTRSGSTKEDTRYGVTPNRQEPTPAALKAIGALALHELDHKARASAAQSPSPQEEKTEDEVPF